MIGPSRYPSHSVSFSTAKAYSDRVKKRLGLCYRLFKNLGWSSGKINHFGGLGNNSVHYEGFSRSVQLFLLGRVSAPSFRIRGPAQVHARLLDLVAYGIGVVHVTQGGCFLPRLRLGEASLRGVEYLHVCGPDNKRLRM